MSIEIQRKSSAYQYRINPFNNLCIDFRENKAFARWHHYARYGSTMATIEALIAIERDAKEPSK